MISGHAECGFLLDHRHDEPQDSGRIRTTINKITKKDRLSSFRMSRGWRLNRIRDVVTKRAKEVDELIKTSVNIADDVEWPGIGSPIRPEGHTLNLNLIDFVRRWKDEHMMK